MKNITFRRLAEQEYAAFREDVKKIFSIAVIETFGIAQDQDEIIPDEDIDLYTILNVKHGLYIPMERRLGVWWLR